MNYRALYLAMLALVGLVWSSSAVLAGVSTTYTVTSNLDDMSTAACNGDGGCTLRRAIALSNDNSGTADTIVFAPALIGQTITLTSDLATITDDLTITGPGSPMLTISTDGDPAFVEFAKGGVPKGATIRKIFRIEGEGPRTVSISGLTVTNAVSDADGAALYADDDNVTLNDMVFVDNFFIYDEDFGGGAVRVSQGDLTITNSLFMGNYSEGAGGAIICGGELTVTDTDFVENHAQSNNGGAMYLFGDGPASLTMTGGMIAGNYADSHGGGIYLNYTGGTAMLSGVLVASNDGGSGGGIYYGSASGNTLMITDSTIEHNYASGSGGGVYFSSGAGALSIENSSIRGNDADSTGGGLYAYAGSSGSTAILGSGIDGNTAGSSGGGFYAGSISTLSISSSSLTDNDSGNDGGGIRVGYTDNDPLFENVIVSGNSAERYGGGLYVYNTAASPQLVHNTITDNTANTDEDPTGDGGGLYVDTSGSSMPVNLVNTILSGNSVMAAEAGSAGKGAGTPAPDCNGTVTSDGVNLVGDDAGCTGLGADDLIGEDAALSDLTAVTGSPVSVRIPQMGSAAIGAADPDECAETDAVGQVRPTGLCDIGAIQTTALLLALLSAQDSGDCTMSEKGSGGASLALLLLAVAGALAFERRRRRS